MVAADEITLISESTTAHGFFDEPETQERTVMCTVRSVGMRETYEARSAGLSPELVFDLANKADYQGEKRILYHGVPYKVDRVYTNPHTEKVELTVERSNADV